MSKPNCYECKYRGEIPGDAHSRCLHPAIKTEGTNPIEAMIEAVCGKFISTANELGIQGDTHAIRNGWFLWPANFDPVWLRSCNGFTPKEE